MLKMKKFFGVSPEPIYLIPNFGQMCKAFWNSFGDCFTECIFTETTKDTVPTRTRAEVILNDTGINYGFIFYQLKNKCIRHIYTKKAQVG